MKNRADACNVEHAYSERLSVLKPKQRGRRACHALLAWRMFGKLNAHPTGSVLLGLRCLLTVCLLMSLVMSWARFLHNDLMRAQASSPTSYTVSWTATALTCTGELCTECGMQVMYWIACGADWKELATVQTPTMVLTTSPMMIACHGRQPTWMSTTGPHSAKSWPLSSHRLAAH